MHLVYPLKYYAYILSCISIETTVLPGAGKIGNNGYAKFWCVNKFRFNLIHPKIVNWSGETGSELR